MGPIVSLPSRLPLERDAPAIIVMFMRLLGRRGYTTHVGTCDGWCSHGVAPRPAEATASFAMAEAIIKHRMTVPAGHRRDYWHVPDANHRHIMAKAVIAALSDAGYLREPPPLESVTIGPDGER